MNNHLIVYHFNIHLGYSMIRMKIYVCFIPTHSSVNKQTYSTYRTYCRIISSSVFCLGMVTGGAPKVGMHKSKLSVRFEQSRCSSSQSGMPMACSLARGCVGGWGYGTTRNRLGVKNRGNRDPSQFCFGSNGQLARTAYQHSPLMLYALFNLQRF